MILGQNILICYCHIDKSYFEREIPFMWKKKKKRKNKKGHGKSICCIYCTHLSTHITPDGTFDSHPADSVKFHIGAFPSEVHSGKTCVGTCDPW